MNKYDGHLAIVFPGERSAMSWIDYAAIHIAAGIEANSGVINPSEITAEVAYARAEALWAERERRLAKKDGE